MFPALRILAFVVSAASLTASHAFAQQPSINTGRLTFGIAEQGKVFDDDQPSIHGPGFTVGLQGRHPFSDSKAFVTDVAVQPVAITNPGFDAHVRMVNLQFGVEFGQRFYVRPSGGIGIGIWTGDSVMNVIDLMPSVGFAIGHRHRLDERHTIAPELFMRAGGGISAFTWIVGFQLGMGS